MVWNGAQLHMLVNHLPVVGFVAMVPALVAALASRSQDVKRFVLLATVVVGLSAFAPYFTGEPAEDVAEKLPGVTKHLIHEHEELAEKATWLSVLTAVAAAAAYYGARKRPDSTKKSVPAVLVFALASAGVMGAAAHEGGKIRHSEIRPESAGADQPGLTGEHEDEREDDAD